MSEVGKNAASAEEQFWIGMIIGAMVAACFEALVKPFSEVPFVYTILNISDKVGVPEGDSHRVSGVYKGPTNGEPIVKRNRLLFWVSLGSDQGLLMSGFFVTRICWHDFGMCNFQYNYTRILLRTRYYTSHKKRVTKFRKFGKTSGFLGSLRSLYVEQVIRSKARILG